MKNTINLFFTLLFPALLNAQTLPNKQIKNSFMQSRLPIQKGSQQINATKATDTVRIGRLHGKSEVFQWNPTWVWQYQEITKYDSKGGLTLDIQITDTINHDTSSKTVNIYFDSYGSVFSEYYNNNSSLQLIQMDTLLNDNHGNIIRYAGYGNPANNQWILDSGVVYKLTYNNAGLETSSQEIVYNTNNYTFINTYWANTLETNFNYDANGNVLSIQFLTYSSSNKTWVDSAHWNFTLNTNGSWESLTMQEWNGSSWVNQYLEDSVTWNDWNGGNYILNQNNNSEQTFFVQKSWNGSSWLDSNRGSTTYDANGGSINTEQLWQQNKWVNADKYSNLIDSLGNSTSSINFDWSNGTWMESFGYLQNYTYDGNGNITQEIDQIYDSATGENVNYFKELYSDFSTYSGIKGANQPKMQITMYPNPATEALHIQENTNTIENMNIAIINMQGQVVVSKLLNGNELSKGVNIPVNNLVNGMYILHAVSGNEESSQKFIKD